MKAKTDLDFFLLFGLSLVLYNYIATSEGPCESAHVLNEQSDLGLHRLLEMFKKD